jgi:hypothetical protein
MNLIHVFIVEKSGSMRRCIVTEVDSEIPSYRAQRFIIAMRKARHRNVSQASLIYFIYLEHISVRLILILSS